MGTEEASTWGCLDLASNSVFVHRGERRSVKGRVRTRTCLRNYVYQLRKDSLCTDGGQVIADLEELRARAPESVNTGQAMVSGCPCTLSCFEIVF